MKSITLNAEARVIERAREEARRRKTTLNAVFREWLAELGDREDRRERIGRLFEEMGNYEAGGSYTREEMNER